jgi:PHP family Zn ribbon phosphoesterase
MSFDIKDVVDGRKVPDVRGLIPWLSKPVRCECGAYCDPDTDYVETQAMIIDIWRCPDCGKRYYREADDLRGKLR